MTWGRAEWVEGGAVYVARHEKTKKEEFPGFMKNMLPGNSFPQICVVSVNESVGNELIVQGYIGSMYLGNHFSLLISK